ncbi:hypothetical protein FH609_008320 [Streptomyces sp. 3MP-14]|uniref:FTP domain-containing protein n=1 Tax=Streptomyces mimosae TaxID=2586635 RepID=A0A5N6AKH5_9ACTN|nr:MULTISPECIES: hypothetical protein [Streptomyces]KAB8168612.1 hypothetical protein FH607_005045 [Streptomyces mimosae]KAB8178108.1 hypothetical protein FH609_008320 [Streptomyces sp. 3MP-14]
MTETDESHEETRRRWPTVTAVAAGMVLLAGALYGVGLARDGDQADAGRSGDEPLALDAGSGAGELARDELTVSPAERSALPGPLVLGEDPPSAPDAAAVYRFEEAGVDAERVAGLAADLGLVGEPEAAGGSWSVVGTPEGTRRGALLVADEAPGHWFYSLDGAVPDGGEVAERPADPGIAPGEPDPSGGGLDPDSSVSSDEMPPADQPPAVSEEVALQAAEPLLSALDLGDGAVDAATVSGPHRLVVAEPVVDGLPVAGMDLVATVGPDGEVVSASGTLGVPSAGEERAVTDALAALERINEAAETAAARDIGRPCLQQPEPGALPEAEGVEPALPDLPCDGQPDAGEPTPATVELGLSLERSAGEPLLVPAWIFRAEGADGQRYAVGEPAVEHVLSSASADSSGEAGDDASGDSSGDVDEDASDARPGDAGAGEDGAEGTEEVAPTEPVEQPTAGLWVADHSPEATTLTVHFWAGVCDTYEVTATESADEVVLGVEATNPDSDEVCIMLAEQQTDEVTLQAPVGDRRLVDAQGRTVAAH